MDTKVNNTSSALNDYSIDKKKPEKSNELGQDVFLKLMIAQLKNQDPTNPTDSQGFLQQLAQFSTVNGITSLQTSVSKLATSLQSAQALQASTLVGRSVLSETELVNVASGRPHGSMVDLPEAVDNLKVSIKKSSGELIRELTLGKREAGMADIPWDGKDAKGKPVPDGLYQISATTTVDGEQSARSVLVRAQVSSVTLPRDGTSPILNVAGIGAISLDKVKQVI
jgi:flagellar basal-body rod modification protein FlgD